MRLSGAIYPDQCVAVAPLVQALQASELERRPPVALCHNPGPGREHRSQRCRELPSKRGRMAIWGIEEHEIVLTRVSPCAPQERGGALAADLCVDPELPQVAPD